jgi:predicted DNA-binding transcriptional regulator YafY
MSDTAPRLITLIQLLQRRPNQKTASLAAELGISVRSFAPRLRRKCSQGQPKSAL